MQASQTFQHNIQSILNVVIEQPAHKKIPFSLDSLDKNILQQYKSRIADRAGQLADYRIRLKDGRGLHIQKYSDCYRVHWDYCDMATNPLGHLVKDAPHHLKTILEVILVALGVATVYYAVRN